MQESPPEKRLYTFDNVIEFLDSLGCLPSEVGRTNSKAFCFWIEHMEAGDFQIGMTVDEIKDLING